MNKEEVIKQYNLGIAMLASYLEDNGKEGSLELLHHILNDMDIIMEDIEDE